MNNFIFYGGVIIFLIYILPRLTKFSSKPRLREASIESNGIYLKSQGYIGPLNSLEDFSYWGLNKYNPSEGFISWDNIQKLSFGSWWRWWTILTQPPKRYLIINTKDSYFYVVPLYMGSLSWNAIKATLNSLGKRSLLDADDSFLNHNFYKF